MFIRVSSRKDSLQTLSTGLRQPSFNRKAILGVWTVYCFVCRGVGWGVEGSRLEAWMKSHKSEVAIT